MKTINKEANTSLLLKLLVVELMIINSIGFLRVYYPVVNEFVLFKGAFPPIRLIFGIIAVIFIFISLNKKLSFLYLIGLLLVTFLDYFSGLIIAAIICNQQNFHKENDDIINHLLP